MSLIQHIFMNYCIMLYVMYIMFNSFVSSSGRVPILTAKNSPKMGKKREKSGKKKEKIRKTRKN